MGFFIERRRAIEGLKRVVILLAIVSLISSILPANSTEGASKSIRVSVTIPPMLQIAPPSEGNSGGDIKVTSNLDKPPQLTQLKNKEELIQQQEIKEGIAGKKATFILYTISAR